MRLVKPNEQFEEQMIVNQNKCMRVSQKLEKNNHGNQNETLILGSENMRNKVILKSFFEYLDNNK